MPVPQGNASPNRYEINPVDDRAVVAVDPEASEVYYQIAAAIEAITDVRKDPAVYRRLNKGTRAGLNSAESSLRRAAFSLVIFAGQGRS